MEYEILAQILLKTAFDDEKMNFSLVVATVFLLESQLCAEKFVIYANCIPKGYVTFSPSINQY